jgi:hypothetical protein
MLHSTVAISAFCLSTFWLVGTLSVTFNLLAGGGGGGVVCDAGPLIEAVDEVVGSASGAAAVPSLVSCVIAPAVGLAGLNVHPGVVSPAAVQQEDGIAYRLYDCANQPQLRATAHVLILSTCPDFARPGPVPTGAIL